MEAKLIYVESCPGWRSARERLRQAIEYAGIGAVSVVVRCVITHHEALLCGLRGSPTILIDGADPFTGSDAGAGIYCRSFPTQAGPDTAPSVAQLVAALRRASEDALRLNGAPETGAPAVLTVPALRPQLATGRRGPAAARPKAAQDPVVGVSKFAA